MNRKEHLLVKEGCREISEEKAFEFLNAHQRSNMGFVIEENNSFQPLTGIMFMH